MATTTPPRSCKATTQSGKPCRARARPGREWCFSHDPELAAKRAEARSKGGKARHRRKIRHVLGDPESWPVQSTQDILSLLEWAIADCLKLERSIKRTNALNGLIRTAITVNEQTELADRIAALEARLDAAPMGANGRKHYHGH